eukprot:COSAG02_NODE_6646_length_3437_cov_43.473699_3_plen_94_part_00
MITTAEDTDKRKQQYQPPAIPGAIRKPILAALTTYPCSTRALESVWVCHRDRDWHALATWPTRIWSTDARRAGLWRAREQWRDHHHNKQYQQP